MKGIGLKKRILNKSLGIDTTGLMVDWKFGIKKDNNEEWLLQFVTDPLKEEDMEKVYNRFLKPSQKKNFWELGFDRNVFMSIPPAKLKEMEQSFITALKPVDYVPKRFKVLRTRLDYLALKKEEDKFVVIIQFGGILI